MMKDEYRPLDNDALERLKALGYAHLYFDESEQVDDWLDDARGKDARKLDETFGPIQPSFLIAIPAVSRNKELDNYGWLHALLDLEAVQAIARKVGREIFFKKSVLTD